MLHQNIRPKQLKEEGEALFQLPASRHSASWQAGSALSRWSHCPSSGSRQRCEGCLSVPALLCSLWTNHCIQVNFHLNYSNLENPSQMCPELRFHGDSKPYRVDNSNETLTAGLPFQRNEDKATQKKILLGCQHSRMNLVNIFKHRGPGDSFLKYCFCKEREYLL